jgi:hypothetical protein
MWMDRLAQIDTADPADLPTASTYFATHTPADMIARMQKGLRRLHPKIAETMWPNRSFEPAWLVLAVGIFAFLAGFKRQALSSYLRRHKNIFLFTFFLLSFFYLSLIWYVAGSSAETRFIIPFLGPVYLLLADVVVSLTRGLWQQLGSGGGEIEIGLTQKIRWPQAALGAGLALLIGWAVWWQVDTARAEAWALAIDPYEADRSANAEVEQIIQWLSTDNPTAEALVAFGPSKSLPLWKFPAHITPQRLPYDVNTWAKMQTYLRDQAPAYIIIDDDTARRRREALSGHFLRQDGFIVFEQTPPGWALDFVYPGMPCKWCIFSPAPASETHPLATLEPGIELLDWRVNEAGVQQAGDTILILQPSSSNPQLLRITLIWRARTSLPADYTVFVHLTAPDGFVKAQQDQPPFGNARPTSHWQPGEVLADRYDLTLDPSLTAGDYLLLVGMYTPGSGERLTVLDGPPGPAPGTILLGTVPVKTSR